MAESVRRAQGVRKESDAIPGIAYHLAAQNPIVLKCSDRLAQNAGELAFRWSRQAGVASSLKHRAAIEVWKCLRDAH